MDGPRVARPAGAAAVRRDDDLGERRLGDGGRMRDGDWREEEKAGGFAALDRFGIKKYRIPCDVT